MRCFSVLYLIFFCVVLRSQNSIHITSISGEPFTVTIAGSKNKTASQISCRIDSLQSDTITVSIEMQGMKHEQQLFLLEKGKKTQNKEFNYALRRKENKLNLQFSGIHSISRLPEPLVPVKPIVDTTYKLKNNVLGHYCELKEGRATFFNNVPVNDVCVNPMPPKYIDYAKFLFMRAQNDADKYQVLEITCRNNCLSTTQFNQLLQWLPFELEKLKLIKSNYNRITNRQNLQHLDSSLHLESSRNELKIFLKETSTAKNKQVKACAAASTEAEMTTFLNQLSVYGNDAEKMLYFKKVYDDYCYSTEHTRKIISQYIHDREKLDAAKMIYYYCTEKEQFLKISDLYSYTTSVAELEDFVSKQKK